MNLVFYTKTGQGGEIVKYISGNEGNKSKKLNPKKDPKRKI